MKLMLSGFETPAEISKGHALSLEIENRRLFARICQSVRSELGEEALEPYAVYDDEGGKVRPSKAFLFAFDPFDLPWHSKSLIGKVIDRMEGMLLSDDGLRQAIEGRGRALSVAVEEMGFQLQSDYAFKVDWAIAEYLKSFDFEVEVNEADSLLENLIKFIKLAEDASCGKIICFLNLKSFLDEMELEEFFSQVFRSDLHVLLLEDAHDDRTFEYERKMLIDEAFLQEW